MIKFYTNPPIEYPYQLILFDDFIEDKINPSHEYILDSGVYKYKDKIIETGDYPNLEKYKILDYITPFTNIEVVIPDYPCDFLGNNKKWIEKTFRNIDWFFKRFPQHQFLPTIQSYFGDFTSLVNSFERFIKDYPTIKRIAIGNLCIMRKMKIYKQMERYLRSYMKKGYYFHIFGMNLGALKYFKSWKCLS